MKTSTLAQQLDRFYAAAMAAEEHQPVQDEVLLRDVPGKFGILVFLAATVALGWEVFGTMFTFSWPFIRLLPTIDAGDVVGAAVFATGWSVLLVGLLVLRHRRHRGAD